LTLLILLATSARSFQVLKYLFVLRKKKKIFIGQWPFTKELDIFSLVIGHHPCPPLAVFMMATQ